MERCPICGNEVSINKRLNDEVGIGPMFYWRIKCRTFNCSAEMHMYKMTLKEATEQWNKYVRRLKKERE
jgi:hypothetical protein